MISPATLHRIWQEHSRRLICLARARAQSDAEDVVQEAFVRLACQQVLPDDPLAWLVKAVRNLAIDASRSSSRRRRREADRAVEQQAWVVPNVEQALDATEVTAQLGKLSDIDREIIVGHLWSDLSFRQISDMLQMPHSTVHRRYQAAVEQLRMLVQASAETNL